MYQIKRPWSVYRSYHFYININLTKNTFILTVDIPILSFPGSLGTQDEQIFVTASNLNYVVILIVRPLGLIATFLAAYGVRHFYPNVFCYE